MKKKILALCLVVVLAITAVTGATLAYFTDTEDDINVFTLGNVVIDLVEEQRKADKSGLEKFADNKVLLPIVGSAQGEKEKVGGYELPTAKNWVDKIINVENEGSQPAYVRVLFAFPAKMDGPTVNDMLMHWNYDVNEVEGTWTRTGGSDQVTLKDGETYNIYNFTYTPVLPAGERTIHPALLGVYIDSRVNATVGANEAITYSMKNDAGVTYSATYAKNATPKLYVLTQAVQSEGFDNADAALTAGFGVVNTTNAQTWFDAVTADDQRADFGN